MLHLSHVCPIPLGVDLAQGLDLSSSGTVRNHRRFSSFAMCLNVSNHRRLSIEFVSRFIFLESSRTDSEDRSDSQEQITTTMV